MPQETYLYAGIRIHGQHTKCTSDLKCCKISVSNSNTINQSLQKMITLLIFNKGILAIIIICSVFFSSSSLPFPKSSIGIQSNLLFYLCSNNSEKSKSFQNFREIGQELNVFLDR